uniref:Uncharacterized protein MANES_13G069100 n=1 Tax=Rhizophora mucronata TaxID=61149 RepID=A0A2P2LKG2_RHIMU
MEALVKEYQKKFRKVREEMDQWDLLQSQLLSQFRNAVSIIERLQLIQDRNSYGALECVEGVRDAVLRKQLESLDSIFISMNQMLEELHDVVKFLERTHRNTRQWVNKLTTKQLDQQVGLKPCVRYCSDSLMLLHEMHQSEYLLKSSLVSALSVLTLKPSRGGHGLQVEHSESHNDGDLMALQQLLIDQPNIPKEEVQFIFEIIFADETF